VRVHMEIRNKVCVCTYVILGRIGNKVRVYTYVI